MSPNRTSEQGSVWGIRAALNAPLFLRASNKTLFCVLAGCPLESRPVAKRPHSEPTRRGGMPPSTLAPPPEAREGGAGAGSRRRAGGVPRGQSWRRHRVCSAARASQLLRPAVRAHRARPAMAAATLPPRTRWLTLLLPLLLCVGPVRADSKVLSALGPGHCSAGSRARGGAMAGGAHQGCPRSGAKDRESVNPTGRG